METLLFHASIYFTDLATMIIDFIKNVSPYPSSFSLSTQHEWLHGFQVQRDMMSRRNRRAKLK